MSEYAAASAKIDEATAAVNERNRLVSRGQNASEVKAVLYIDLSKSFRIFSLIPIAFTAFHGRVSF